MMGRVAWIIQVGLMDSQEAVQEGGRSQCQRGEAEVRVITLCRRWKGPQPGNAGSLWKLEKARKQILPLEAPEGTQLC